jgi:hypothetical protein
MCQGGANPDWIATVIRTEADAPLQGSVDGITQADVAVRLKEPMSGMKQSGSSVHVHD